MLLDACNGVGCNRDPLSSISFMTSASEDLRFKTGPLQNAQPETEKQL